MKRLLPAPLLSVALFVLWLLLNRSLALSQLLLALLLALAIPLITAGLRPMPVRIRRPA
ncbi:MAG: multicomponent K+:H+ antiporter subunit E, partial [Rhodoferax sp.]